MTTKAAPTGAGLTDNMVRRVYSILQQSPWLDYLSNTQIPVMAKGGKALPISEDVKSITEFVYKNNIEIDLEQKDTILQMAQRFLYDHGRINDAIISMLLKRRGRKPKWLVELSGSAPEQAPAKPTPAPAAPLKVKADKPKPAAKEAPPAPLTEDKDVELPNLDQGPAMCVYALLMGALQLAEQGDKTLGCEDRRKTLANLAKQYRRMF